MIIDAENGRLCAGHLNFRSGQNRGFVQRVASRQETTNADAKWWAKRFCPPPASFFQITNGHSNVSYPSFVRFPPGDFRFKDPIQNRAAGLKANDTQQLCIVWNSVLSALTKGDSMGRVQVRYLILLFSLNVLSANRVSTMGSGNCLRADPLQRQSLHRRPPASLRGGGLAARGQDRRGRQSPRSPAVGLARPPNASISTAKVSSPASSILTAIRSTAASA